MLRTTLAAALIALPSVASAGGFAEAVLGAGIPIADSEYTDTVDTSFKVGVRAGSLGEQGAGAELTLDFTPVSFSGPTTFGDVETTAQRFRALVGGRLQRPIGGPALLLLRAGAGVDLGHVATEGTVFGLTVDESQTDVGLALEFGAGIGVQLGTAYVAGQLAVPLAFHFDDDDPDDTHDYDFEYTGVDLDVLFSGGVTF